jgi:uridylate kinase
LNPERVIVKLSGERLSGRGPGGFSPLAAESLSRAAADLAGLTAAGYEVGVVCGAGNLLRGRDSAFSDRVAADTAGMLATVINALALADALTAAGTKARAYSVIAMPGHAAVYRPEAVREFLDSGGIGVFGGGTGAPFVTTDTAAALRALELGAEAILKTTQVDGVYSADPATNPAARRYDRLTYDEYLELRLGVMDLAAVELCRRGGVEILVFSGEAAGGPLKALTEPGFATVIGPEKPQ